MIDYKGKRVLVATSAGMDSMALLDMLRKHNADVFACYINHLQRPQEIAVEIACIQQYCNLYHIPFSVYKIDFTHKKINDNNQDFFRIERYKLLLEHARRLNISYIATGHHLDDQVETQFMRLIKNYDVLSFRSIREQLNVDDIIIIRPLLKLRKTELQQYCLEHQLVYCDDSSNKVNKYFRNTIRNEIFPILEQENHQFIHEFNNNIEGFVELYQLKYDELKKTILSYPNYKYSKISIPILRELLKLKSAIEKKIIVEVIVKEVFQYQDRLKGNIVASILQLIESPFPTQDKITISSLVFIGKQYEYLYCWYKKDINILIPLNGTKIKKEGIAISYCQMDESFIPQENIYSFVCDKELLTKEIVLSNNKKGSYIKIHNGTKKMNRLYIDEKLLPSEREHALVVKDNSSGEVLFDLSSNRINVSYNEVLINTQNKVRILITIS